MFPVNAIYVSSKCSISIYICGSLIRKSCFLLEYHVWKINIGDCQQSFEYRQHREKAVLQHGVVAKRLSYHFA